MHDVQNMKVVDAQQAKMTDNYKNIKVKLHKINASTWFNTIHT
jgi:hypothetical protein